MNTTLQIRIDQPTKLKAQKAFKSMGMTLSGGLKYILTNISKENDYVCEHGYQHSYPKKLHSNWRQEIEKELKTGKKYSTAKEMFHDLDK